MVNSIPTEITVAEIKVHEFPNRHASFGFGLGKVGILGPASRGPASRSLALWYTLEPLEYPEMK